MFGLKPKIQTQSDYNLEYLFVAELYNGQIVKQTPDDKPRFADGGTMMTDLMKEKVKRFSLVGKGHVFMVDLTDGHFEIDGRKIWPPAEVLPRAELKLIYYRILGRGVTIQANINNQGLVGKLMHKAIPQPKVKYILGWHYSNVGGKDHEWKMGVD